MKTHVWRIGQLLNSVQSTFVGLLRIWSIPIVLMLSLASGYTTYYGMSHFITWWIALIITVAVQSIIVICSLELAGLHWRASATRYFATIVTLSVALFVSISFSYFKFYELSEQESVLMDQYKEMGTKLDAYLEGPQRLKSELMTHQRKRIEQAAEEANLAYTGLHPSMQGDHRNKVGRGPFYDYYRQLHQAEQDKAKALEQSFAELEGRIADARGKWQAFSSRLIEFAAYDAVVSAFIAVQTQADELASRYGLVPVPPPAFGPHAQFTRGITPSFEMWKRISWFALACAAMVDFFTLVLSYRLEFTAPGPLTEEEKELAYLGIKQFADFTLNRNDELEFVIEKTELERARRYSDWLRMFVVAFLLSRGYLRKISDRSVVFAPNLYPIISERLRASARNGEIEAPGAANEDRLKELVEKKIYG